MSNVPESTADKKDKQDQNQPQNFTDLINAIVPLAREYIDFKKNEFEARERRIIAVGKHNRNLTYSLLGFLSIVIALMTFLTFTTKISSDALLFLVGTLTGYMILWVQDLLFSPTEVAEEPT